MSSLVMVLAGPLQSWGLASRHHERRTEAVPTKSGVLGMIASALGRDRSHPVNDLAALRFGAREDQPGRLLRDFHTVAKDRGGDKTVTDRHYLQDAVFTVALEGDLALLEQIETALRAPAYPLFLGRRSCVPSVPVIGRIVSGGAEEALRAEGWHADPEHRLRREREGAAVRLRLHADVPVTHPHAERSPDTPLSFDPAHRRYAVRHSADLTPVTVWEPPAGHNPLAALD